MNLFKMCGAQIWVSGSIPGSGKGFMLVFLVMLLCFLLFLSKNTLFVSNFEMLIYLVYLTYCKICDRL